MHCATKFLVCEKKVKFRENFEVLIGYSKWNLYNIKFTLGHLLLVNVGFMTFYGIFLEIWSGSHCEVTKSYLLRSQFLRVLYYRFLLHFDLLILFLALFCTRNAQFALEIDLKCWIFKKIYTATISRNFFLCEIVPYSYYLRSD